MAGRYDALLVDLDGVVHRGDRPIDRAVAALAEVRRTGPPVVFLTNNSSATVSEVAARLHGLGVAAEPSQIVTSAEATAAMLVREGMAGSTAFVIGERGIRDALMRAGIAGLEPEAPPPDATDLVIVGFDRSVDYAKLRTVALLVQRGARLVATNADASYPAPDGLWPGAGALLAAVTATTGATATVVGKPARPLFDAAAEAATASRPLVVGDRLDTDVAGAAAMGWDSMLVLSGVTTPPALLRSRPLPTYVARDLSGVLAATPRVEVQPAAPAATADVVALLERSGLDATRDGGATIVLRDVDDGRILATATTADLGDGEFLLRSVAVEPEARGSGLGMLAVAAATDAAVARGAGRLLLFTETAEPFFARLGFVTIDRTALPGVVARSRQATIECPASAVTMRLDLRAS